MRAIPAVSTQFKAAQFSPRNGGLAPSRRSAPATASPKEAARPTAGGPDRGEAKAKVDAGPEARQRADSLEAKLAKFRAANVEGKYDRQIGRLETKITRNQSSQESHSNAAKSLDVAKQAAGELVKELEVTYALASQSVSAPDKKEDKPAEPGDGKRPKEVNDAARPRLQQVRPQSHELKEKLADRVSDPKADRTELRDDKQEQPVQEQIENIETKIDKLQSGNENGKFDKAIAELEGKLAEIHGDKKEQTVQKQIENIETRLDKLQSGNENGKFDKAIAELEAKLAELRETTEVENPKPVPEPEVKPPEDEPVETIPADTEYDDLTRQLDEMSERLEKLTTKYEKATSLVNRLDALTERFDQVIDNILGSSDTQSWSSPGQHGFRSLRQINMALKVARFTDRIIKGLGRSSSGFESRSLANIGKMLTRTTTRIQSGRQVTGAYNGFGTSQFNRQLVQAYTIAAFSRTLDLFA